MRKTLLWIVLCLNPSLTACALFSKPKPTPAPVSVPEWVLGPIEVVDLLPEDATVRDVSAQALEYRRAFGECSARLDVLRGLNTAN